MAPRLTTQVLTPGDHGKSGDTAPERSPYDYDQDLVDELEDAATLAASVSRGTSASVGPSAGSGTLQLGVVQTVMLNRTPRPTPPSAADIVYSARASSYNDPAIQLQRVSAPARTPRHAPVETRSCTSQRRQARRLRYLTQMRARQEQWHWSNGVAAQARPSLIPPPCTHFTRAGIEWRR